MRTAQARRTLRVGRGPSWAGAGGGAHWDGVVFSVALADSQVGRGQGDGALGWGHWDGVVFSVALAGKGLLAAGRSDG